MMQPRFTVIQGGLAQGGQAARAEAFRTAGWRIAVRRPFHLDAAEIAAWRALHAGSRQSDPFADPDFLVTAGQHAPRIEGGVVFALAYALGRNGQERLAGALPLQLPHPLWGGPTIRLWQPVLAGRPVEPVFEDGGAPPAVAAVLAHLRSVRPNTELRLTGLAADGATVQALRAQAGFRVAEAPCTPAIPRAQFVEVGGRQPVERTEHVSDPHAVRDAVERFLLADAKRSRTPLLHEPGAAATVRVVSRLLARRGLAEVELGLVNGEPVCGAIRLGAAGERVVWRTIGHGQPASIGSRTADVEVAPKAEPCPIPSRQRLRLVASRG